MNAIIISKTDNVAIVLQDIAKGDEVIVGENIMTAIDDIPYTHKIALTDIFAGFGVIKYGEVIATASQDIRRGQWVHVHNLKAEVKDW